MRVPLAVKHGARAFGSAIMPICGGTALVEGDEMLINMQQTHARSTAAAACVSCRPHLLDACALAVPTDLLYARANVYFRTFVPQTSAPIRSSSKEASRQRNIPIDSLA